VVEKATDAVFEAPCRFCPSKNRYIIDHWAQPEALSGTSTPTNEVNDEDHVRHN
jgi:hypothetical protein